MNGSILNAGAQGRAGVPGRTQVLLALVLSGWAGSGAHGQQLLEGRGKIAEYYGRPNQTQMSLFLEGSRVQPLTKDQLLITEPRLQTFSVRGETNLTAQAPQCIMDRRRGTISSSGPIQAQLAQGRFLISGDGFLLRQTNSDLTISNHVRTLLQPEMLARASAEAGPGKGPVEILSRQFEYSTNYGLAVWRGDVRLKGEQIAMNCEVLTAKLPSGQGGVQSVVAPSSGLPGPGRESSSSEGRLERITAEQHVSVDYAGFQATGDAAVYTTETDQLQLSGHPAWRAQSREGSADELVVERTNQVLRATGHGMVKMPGQGLARVGLHSHGGPESMNAVSPPPGPASGERPPSTLEVLSESYILWTNLAEFRGPVQVSERVGAEVRGTMTCARLTAGFGQTNQLERMMAEHDVAIRQEGTEFLAGKAVYEGAKGLMDLTEAPRWQSGLRRGSGDLIRLSTAPEGMLVVGHAVMRLPAE
ncbi:MAG TPA: LptA/OstA family protein, partial [Dongiaceae bacterium]|nr:LptA/OstA family protein [Dongiaceae bacterium]